MNQRLEINVSGNLGTADACRDLKAAIIRNMDPNRNTVLLVDDERTIRAKLARDVKAFDPTVIVFEAANGKEALERLAAIRRQYFNDPLFIVMDLNMPVMNGWDVIKHLKEEYEAAGKARGIPIIVLSSTSGEKGVFFKQSVLDGKSGYLPLVTVAKETCTEKSRYDAAGAKGLSAWLTHFLK